MSSASIAVHAADAYLICTCEQAADTTFPEQVGRLVADAKDRLEATAMITGSGSGQPFGVITRLAATTASRVAGSSGAVGAADLVLADVYALKNNLPPRYRPNSCWLAEGTTYNSVRQLGSAAGTTCWADLGVDTPSTLLGRPTYEASAMDNTIVSGSNDDVLVLGDFRDGYVIADRLGMSVATTDWVLGSNRRPTGEIGFFAFWRVGGDVVSTNAFRMLRL